MIPIVDLDEAARVVSWSDAAERAFGYTREEAIGVSLADLIKLDVAAWVPTVSTGGTVTLACTTRSGEPRTYAWRCQPIRDEHGRYTGAIVVGQDTEERGRSLEARRQAQLLRLVTKHLPIVLWSIEADGVFTSQEGAGLASLELSDGEHVGESIFGLYPQIVDEVRRALAGELVQYEVVVNGVSWVSWVVPVRDHDVIVGAVGVSLDVTSTKHAEVELRERLGEIERQRQTIRALSTPIIQVWDRVLTMPLVGVLDSVRTAEVLQDLLEAVTRTQSEYAILDLTGVDAVDTKTAAYLIELVHAVRLLGAEGIITGIRPSVAQTVVALGLDLGTITTLGNLKAGLRHCIARLAARRAPKGGV